MTAFCPRISEEKNPLYYRRLKNDCKGTKTASVPRQVRIYAKGLCGQARLDIIEVDKMLDGERIGYDTARKFVYFLKADRAQYLIDWDKLSIGNPLARDCDDYGDTVKEDAE